MKYYLTIYFLISIVLVFGQNSIDFDQLIKSWTQGKIDSNGKVIAIITRGGCTQLKICKDSTVSFSTPFMCGFGFGTREGKWKLNQNDTSITFTFYKHIGYMANPGTTYINETEKYKIIKLTEEELSLFRSQDIKTMLFAKTNF